MLTEKKHWILLGCLWAVLSACTAPQEHTSTSPESEETASSQEDSTPKDDAANDPFEPINRILFVGNRHLDKALLRPLALIYRDTLPDKVQESVSSALDNFQAPVTFANDILQGKGERAAQTFARFAINSTAGVGGLFDVAKQLDILGHREDFGQTLAVWGAPSGPYLMIPLLGPSSPRDLMGKGADFFLDPATYVFSNNNLNGVGWGIKDVDVVRYRADLVDLSDQLEEESVDFYATIRSIYFQKRESDIVDGAQTTANVVEDELYDFGAQ